MIFQTPAHPMSNHPMFAPVNTEQYLGASNGGRNNIHHGTARRALFLDDSKKDIPMDDKSDRKCQGDDLIEYSVPAKRFKSS